MKQISEPPKIGAALIAVLYALGGIALLLSALFMNSINITAYPEMAFFTSIGAVFLFIMGAISLILSYGLWNTQPWAWMIVIVLSVINLVGSIMSFNLPGMIIPGIIVWYLYTNKEDFGI